jgi:arylsulfatase A-like enzyme
MHIVDLYPTLLNLAGASLEQTLPLDGMDILRCLTEGRPSPRKEILHNSTPSNGAIRIGDWKLIVRDSRGAEGESANPKKKKRAATQPTMELYDLAADPFEKCDLATQRPEKLKELRARYDALARQAAKPKNLPD